MIEKEMETDESGLKWQFIEVNTESAD